MQPEDLVKLNSAVEIPNKIKAICGPGTGLGVSMMAPFKLFDKTMYKVWPGEGGHCSFPLSKEIF